MKFIKTIAISFLLFSSLQSCRDSDNISIKVVDNEDLYKYSAKFPRNKSHAVERFINNRIAPTYIKSDSDLDVTTILNDKTKFHYESSPGELIIELDKTENNTASYFRIKKMCEDLNRIVNPKK
ncbi:hypothetical protein [Dyadobacter sp. CY323]|uniref:hypothetical protein n=1 Tax=Dyadobacter sp. CY323 TaxID=2907302 RepID=UPI001F253BA9|nr:hypothetical protein [Dyadobacter sp. CY323]MCE6987833.1 hypothetical protein [Dyadobacter sp. CY323]